MAFQIVILAAGKGRRMETTLPKVMHQVGGKSMLERIINNSLVVTNDVVIVYSPALYEYLAPYQNTCKFALQAEPLGTAHAVNAALDLIHNDKINLVIYADNPFISPEIISDLYKHVNQTGVALVTLAFICKKPNQYGRIITDKKGNFLKIVEFKKASKSERKIKLCNSGIMAFSPGILQQYIPYYLSNNHKYAGEEFYLTAVVEICMNHGEKVSYMLHPNTNEVIGVNTREELIEANSIIIKEA